MEAGLESLSRLHELESLDLSNTNVTNAVVAQLPSLTALTQVCPCAHNRQTPWAACFPASSQRRLVKIAPSCSCGCRTRRWSPTKACNILDIVWSFESSSCRAGG